MLRDPNIVGPKNKFDATAAPTVSDDETEGYSIGSRWIDVTAGEAYVLFDATEDAADWQEDGSGAILTIDDYDLTALATATNQDPVVVTGISHTPRQDGLVQVEINGHAVAVGDGTKVADCYFSGDGGTNARNISAIEAGDTCRWMGSIAGYQLTTADTVSFIYGV